MVNNRLVIVLVLVIVILAGILVFSFLVKPSFDNYVAEKRTEGYNIAVSQIYTDIFLQVQQNGFVQIPVGGNQTLLLAPVTTQPA